MSEKVATSPLTLAIHRMDDAAIVRCSGRLVADVSDSFYLEIKQLIPEFKGIVLDLTDLTHMDSMGLGALVRVYVSAKSTGCSLKLMNLGKPVRQLLGVTHLLSVFQIIGENNIKII
jgi:anti-sigma B factor antagonist